MRERNYQIIFSHWLKEVYRQIGCFELKRAKNDTLYFNQLASHQIAALLNAKHGIFVYKIPDVGFQNPFDCFSLAGIAAYIVGIFSGSFEIIDIDVFIENCRGKKITYEQAKKLSTYSIDIP